MFILKLDILAGIRYLCTPVAPSRVHKRSTTFFYFEVPMVFNNFCSKIVKYGKMYNYFSSFFRIVCSLFCFVESPLRPWPPSWDTLVNVMRSADDCVHILQDIPTSLWKLSITAETAVEGPVWRRVYISRGKPSLARTSGSLSVRDV